MNLVASFLRQIVEDSKTEFSDKIRKLYEKFNQSSSRPTLDNILTTLKLELREFAEIFIIVDALDECAESDSRSVERTYPRHELLKALKTLFDNRDIRVLFTTRLDSAAQRQLPGEILEIRATDHDIGVYLDEQIRKTPRIKAWEIDDLIKSKIIEKAQGM